MSSSVPFSPTCRLSRTKGDPMRRHYGRALARDERERPNRSRLEIGVGDCPLGDGWLSVDAGERGDFPGVVWGRDRLPFDDCKFDVVYASHVIEHVPWHDVGAALREALRVLCHGGTLEVWTVDFSKLVEAYRKGEPLDPWRAGGLNNSDDVMPWICSRLFAYDKHGDEWNWHKSIFDERHLAACMIQAGFKKVGRLRKPRGYDHGIINLGMAGTKP